MTHKNAKYHDDEEYYYEDDIEKVKIPLWLLGVDDIALLLEVNSRSQLPIIEKAMKLVTIFAREESQVLKSKNTKVLTKELLFKNLIKK